MKPKGRIWFFIIPLFGSAILPLGAQVDMGLHGSVETLYAIPFSRDLGLTDSRAAFTGELNAVSGQAAAFVSLSGEYNGISPDRTGFSLGEAWVDWSAGAFTVRLGRQLLSWGVADGLILTDVVCPQNLTAYAGLDFAGSRIAVDGLRLRYSFLAFMAEAVWLPVFTPAKLPGDPENPLYGIFYSGLSPVDLGGQSLPVSVSKPALPRTPADGEYGLRLSWYTPAMDFSFSGFYGWNDIPSMSKKLTALPGGQAAEIELSPVYGRTITVGADAGIPLGDLLLRLETAWTGGGFYDRGLSAEESAALLLSGQADDPITRHNLKALAGIDWNPQGWTLSVQYYEDLLPEARGGGTGRPWRKNGLSLRIAKGLFRETLSLSAWCYLDLGDFDTSSGAAADYALTDFLSLSLGTDLFTGGIDNRGTYAAYRDLNGIWVKGIFRF
jgi:hypothetical protein